MGFAIGLVLSLGVAVFGRVVGFDRDRAFYPTVLMVIASYYVLFAVMGGNGATVGIEIGAMTVFAAAAVAGFRGNLWVVAVGLACHGVFDFFHGSIVANGGVPAWWPPFCLAYDAGAAGGLGWLIWRARVKAR